MHRLVLSIAIAAVATGCAQPSQFRSTTVPPADAMSEAIRGLCTSDVALLGEGASHADGRTLAFKAALVRRLVEECDFNAIVFEASSYDFLEMDRRRPAELSGLLSGDQGDRCRSLFRRLIYGQLGSSPEEQAPLKTCLVDIQTVLQAMPESADRDARLQNLDNIGRVVSRQGMDTTEYLEGRSHSMLRNYQWWLADRFPQGSRVIVWGATVHLSRSARAHPRFAMAPNFGSYMDRAYGERASFLGFSAASGTYLEGGQVRERAPAASGSLEALALGDTPMDLTYLDQASLRRLGAVPGAVFSKEPVVARWSDVVDGVIVFREEHAPGRSPDR